MLLLGFISDFCCYIGSQGWGCMNLFTRVNTTPKHKSQIKITCVVLSKSFMY